MSWVLDAGCWSKYRRDKTEQDRRVLPYAFCAAQTPRRTQDPCLDLFQHHRTPSPAPRSLCSYVSPSPCLAPASQKSQCLFQRSGSHIKRLVGGRTEDPHDLFLSRARGECPSMGSRIHYNSNLPLPHDPSAHQLLVPEYSLLYPILKSHLKVCLLGELA